MKSGIVNAFKGRPYGNARDGNVRVFREQYQVSRELTSFFEEDSPAVDRLSRDFARTLVSNILEDY